jgi:hypothetical protein
MESESTPPVTQQEALASLQEIDRIMRQVRRSIGAGPTAALLILWGVIWVIGFAAMQFAPRLGSWLWIALDVAGVIGSLVWGPWVRKTPARKAHAGRIGLSWLVLFGYAALWSGVLAPWEWTSDQLWATHGLLLVHKLAAFWALVCMFAYVLMGLWLDRFFLYLGLLVTVATLAGFWLTPAYFFAWMAIAGGGALIAAGGFIRRSWK